MSMKLGLGFGQGLGQPPQPPHFSAGFGFGLQPPPHLQFVQLHIFGFLLDLDMFWVGVSYVAQTF